MLLNNVSLFYTCFHIRMNTDSDPLIPENKSNQSNLTCTAACIALVKGAMGAGLLLLPTTLSCIDSIALASSFIFAYMISCTSALFITKMTVKSEETDYGGVLLGRKNKWRIVIDGMILILQLGTLTVYLGMIGNELSKIFDCPRWSCELLTILTMLAIAERIEVCNVIGILGLFAIIIHILFTAISASSGLEKIIVDNLVAKRPSLADLSMILLATTPHLCIPMIISQLHSPQEANKVAVLSISIIFILTTLFTISGMIIIKRQRYEELPLTLMDKAFLIISNITSSPLILKQTRAMLLSDKHSVHGNVALLCTIYIISRYSESADDAFSMIGMFCGLPLIVVFPLVSWAF